MSPSQLRGRTRVAALGVLVAAALVAALFTATQIRASGGAATVSSPAVQGPIPSTAKPGDPSHNYIFYSTPMNLKKVGYVEQEYFISGTATRYTIPTSSTENATAIGTMPYKTRIVVRRPANPKKFKGVVVVDWQNVTAGQDIDTEWAGPGAFFVRSGWAYVGASVQRIGVHGFDPPNPLAGRGLKQWSPTRYGSLDVTNGGTVLDDSQSYDIYSQIAQLLKHGPANGVNPFKGFKVKRVYAGGVSQSAAFLMRYYNNVQPLTKIFDGFLVGLGGAAPRLDNPTKVFKAYTETDVWRGQAAVRVPDTATTHTWELAGASHVPQAAIEPNQSDYRTNLGGIRDRDIGPQTGAIQCVRPYASNLEVYAFFSAAYAALDRWVAKNVTPPSAPPITVSAAPPSPGLATIPRDANGLASGGVRYPKLAVPIATLTGENLPANLTNPLNAFCVLYGTRIPFDAAKLKALYPNHGAYVREVTRVVNENVHGGFLLKPEAQAIIREAANSTIGN